MYVMWAVIQLKLFFNIMGFLLLELILLPYFCIPLLLYSTLYRERKQNVGSVSKLSFLWLSVMLIYMYIVIVDNLKFIRVNPNPS